MNGFNIEYCNKCGRVHSTYSNQSNKSKCIVIPEESICIKCNTKKPIKLFYKYRVGVKSEGEYFNYSNICIDCYNLHILIPNLIHKQLDIKLETIRKHPELINAWYEQVKVKKLIKTKKHENTKTR